MKRITLFFLTCLLAPPVMAEEVDKRLDAAADGHVNISNISGEITVKGWSRNQVEVTGSLGRNVEKLIFERDGNEITIKVKVPRRSSRGIESDLHIKVPQNSSIDVGTVSADIDVRDVTGDQDLHTVSGDVATESTGADMEAESVSGDVEIVGDNADGEIEASTVSGNVTLFHVAGEISAESVSGDVIVDEGLFTRVEAGTVSGDIVFRAGLRDGGKLGMETVNGDIDVEFSGDVSAKFEVDTFNGQIRNCFGPKAVKTSKYLNSVELVFTEGSGDGRVEISTMNGDVSICKK